MGILLLQKGTCHTQNIGRQSVSDNADGKYLPYGQQIIKWITIQISCTNQQSNDCCFIKSANKYAWKNIQIANKWQWWLNLSDN